MFSEVKSRGWSSGGLCPCARVPVCPWIGLCPCARVPVDRDWVVPGCPCARASDKSRSPEVTRLQAVAVCLLIPQTVLSTLRGSYGRCKGRCLIWVLLTLVCGVLPVNFRMVRLLWHVEDAFRLRRLAQSVCLRSGLIGLPPQHPPPQHQHLPTQHQHHHFPLPWHQLQSTPQYTADVPARNVWLVIKTSQLACHDDVLGLICVRVPIYLCIDISFSLFLSLSLSLSLFSLSFSLSICIAVSLSTYWFILLPMHLYVCVSVFLSIYLSIYLSVCLSVCQPVAAAWCHSSMSSLPVVVDLGVCLTFLLVALLHDHVVALLFACNFVPLCCDALI